MCDVVFFFSSRRRHTRFDCDWSSDVCSSDLETPLFDEYDVEAEIRALFKARVELPTGGYLIIQPTEALISIDVNTGRYTRSEEHTSELQSQSNLVCRLLLEKKITTMHTYFST